MADLRFGPRTGALVYLTFGRLVLNTASRFVFPFLPAISRGLGVSLAQAGLLISVRSLAGLATPAVVAGAGERRQRLAATGLVFFVIGASLTAAGVGYGWALAGFALMGVAKPAYDIASQSYLADHTPYERRARYLTITELTWSGSLLLGAPAVGWLIGRSDWRGPFWALASLGVLALVILPRVVQDRSSEVAPRPGRLSLDRSGVALLGTMGIFAFGTDVSFVVFGAWLESSFGLSLLALGAASTLLALAELTGEGGTMAFADRLGKRRSVMVGLVVSSTGYALWAVASSHLGLGLAVLAVALVGFEFAIVSALPLATEVVPHARARFLALAMVAFAVARAAAAAIGPALFESVGVVGNAMVSTAANLLALGLVLAAVRHH
jgi:predicted MFS family arabinose efflux permease